MCNKSFVVHVILFVAEILGPLAEVIADWPDAGSLHLYSCKARAD